MDETNRAPHLLTCRIWNRVPDALIGVCQVDY